MTDSDDESRRHRMLTGILAFGAVGSIGLVVAMVILLRYSPDSSKTAASHNERQRPQIVYRSQHDAETPDTEEEPIRRSRSLPKIVEHSTPPQFEHNQEPTRPSQRPKMIPVRPREGDPPQRVIKRYPPLEFGKLVHREYYPVKFNGFSVFINRTIVEEDDRSDNRPLDCLQDELERLTAVSPLHAKAMRTIKVFVEWDHVQAGIPNSIAVFYGGAGEGIAAQGVASWKTNTVTVLSMKKIADEKMRQPSPRRGIVLLHEMAHACHFLNLGMANPVVKNTYDQAMTRNLYRSVPTEQGGFTRAYAATNEFEYFAELSCAYLDYCDYYPHDRAELREYDSPGFELMRNVWGEDQSLTAPAKKRGSRP